MGACECENPMEFGYEVNALEKDEKPQIKNKNSKEYNSNYSTKNDNKNFNEVSNVMNSESKNFPNNNNNNNNNYNYNYNNNYNYNSNYNSNNNSNNKNYDNKSNDYNNSPEFPYDSDNQFNQQKMEGVNALRARYENEKNQNDEPDVNHYQSNTGVNNTNNMNDMNNTNNMNSMNNMNNMNNMNISNSNKQMVFNTSVEEPMDDFSTYIFENINKIRENPQSFIDKIEKAKSNIMLDKRGICVYKTSVKVALSRGKPAFDEAIEYLKNCRPMPKLIFSQDLLVTPPTTEEQIKDRTYMNEIINEKVQAGIPIKSFWRDIIKDRETCLILMIVDDTGANSGKKRNDILDPSMQCIGITSKKIGKNFASYVTLC